MTAKQRVGPPGPTHLSIGVTGEDELGMMKRMLIEAQEDELERRYGGHTVYITEDDTHILDDDEWEAWNAMLEAKGCERDAMADVEEQRIARSWNENDAWMQAEEVG